MRVVYESGDVEEFRANNVLVTDAGGLILSWQEMKPAKRFNMQQARWEEGLEMSNDLLVVVAPPRSDKPARENWRRVDPVPEPEPAPDTAGALTLATVPEEAN